MPAKPRRPFSKRHGYPGGGSKIRVREDAPENLRYFVLETAANLGLTPHALREDACAVLRVRPNPDNWSPYPNVSNEVEGLIYSCDWYRVYDFIERIWERFHGIDGDSPKNEELAPAFERELNEFFLDEGIGWQITAEGEIVTRGTEAFESAVHTSVEALDGAGRATARDEIHEALGDLSRRPEPDLTGAIHHAMNALECVMREGCGDPRATLGELLKRNPGLIPKPLDAAVEKAWGYASEMGRHIREGRRPDRKEVELIVGLAATVATYLTR